MHGTKILARLLVAHGAAYTTKFATKSGGFIIMASRLKRFWDIPTIWPLCFSILFGYDVAEIDFDQELELSKLIGIFGQKKVVYPDSLQIVTSMLHRGLKDVLRHQADPDSPSVGTTGDGKLRPTDTQGGRPRSRSMDLAAALQTRCKSVITLRGNVGTDNAASDIYSGQRKSGQSRFRPEDSDSVPGGPAYPICGIPQLHYYLGLGSAAPCCDISCCCGCRPNYRGGRIEHEKRNPQF